METANHEYYVSLEVAKQLKKAGFDWDGMSYYQNGIFYHYSINRGRIIIMNQNSAPNYMEQYSAPTLDVAQRWLRKTHHLHITIFSSSQESWMFRITKLHEKLENGAYGEDFYTYDEAQEAGIKKALELILEKGE